ncbi:SOS response-associated peptidase family protein [Pseudomonas sp. Teo4]|uniref:SOS response-associated peptidase family protein n=1 Tax=Pseudomonas sp. Teo4 TaxID=3064528 RepID=UPI002AB9A12D|nr:SOS response-associated peptidase family protein [Pseudomonas sp. Teo4]MDZ3990773.1 SOS response-associated protein YedK [Pseudomonas sp. Teo4]
MCECFAQYQGLADYLRVLGAEQHLLDSAGNERIGHPGIVPGNRVPILHDSGNGLRMSPRQWGWTPRWAGKRQTASISAPLQNITASPPLHALRPQTRALVMADGWYAWLADAHAPQGKQRYFVRLKSQAPIFVAALAQVRAGLEPEEDDGFVIITHEHDPGDDTALPLVLAPEHARAWISSQRVAEQVQCLPPHAFEWIAVTDPDAHRGKA